MVRRFDPAHAAVIDKVLSLTIRRRETQKFAQDQTAGGDPVAGFLFFLLATAG